MLLAALLPLAEWPVRSLWHQPGCDCVFLPLGSGMRPPELINHRHQEGHLMDMNFNCFPPGRDGNWRPRGEMPRLLLTTVLGLANFPKSSQKSQIFHKSQLEDLCNLQGICCNGILQPGILGNFGNVLDFCNPSQC